MEPKSNNSLIFLVVFVAIIAVMVSMILVSKKSKPARVQRTPDPISAPVKEMVPGTTSLYFSPASQTVSPGQLITVKTYMNTGASLVSGIELKTIFDPNVFEVTKFTKEGVMKGLSQEIKNDIDNQAGVFNYTAFGLDKTLFLNGSNLFLYTLEVKVKESASPGTYTFDFDPSAVVSASDAGQNMFKSSTPLKVTLSGS